MVAVIREGWPKLHRSLACTEIHVDKHSRSIGVSVKYLSLRISSHFVNPALLCSLLCVICMGKFS